MALSPLGIAITQTQAQPAPARPGQVGPTDVLGAYKMATDQANQQYLAKLQQQNSLWGGLAGLGGSALTASILKGNLFGGGNAANTAGNATSSFVPDLGTPVVSNGVQTGIMGVGPTAQGLTDATGAMVPGVPLAGLAPPATDAAFSGVPLAGLDAGTVAGADAAAAAAPAVADAGAATLADLLPFLFA